MVMIRRADSRGPARPPRAAALGLRPVRRTTLALPSTSVAPAVALQIVAPSALPVRVRLSTPLPVGGADCAAAAVTRSLDAALLRGGIVEL